MACKYCEGCTSSCGGGCTGGCSSNGCTSCTGCRGGCQTGCTSCSPCTGGCTSCSGCTSCEGGCDGTCKTTCSGCSGCGGCDGGCSGCRGTCSGHCIGCSGTCEGCSGCSGTCEGTCNGCTGTCEGTCNIGCEGGEQTIIYNNLTLSKIFEDNNMNQIANFIYNEANRRAANPTNISFTQGTPIQKSQIDVVIQNLNKTGQIASYSTSVGAIALAALGNDLITKSKKAYEEIVGLP